MSKCTTIQQGYPSITHEKDCQLSHTGINLFSIVVIAILVISFGAALLAAHRKGW